MKTIQDLIAHVVSECTIVDREERFAQSLDSCGDVNVCGLTFAPSQIWREMDPTAFRCGVNDYMDGENVTEVDGETYEDSEIEAAREGFVEELNGELSALESELESEEEEEDQDADEIARIKSEITAMEAFIKECEAYQF